jgi:hypothetical protein
MGSLQLCELRGGFLYQIRPDLFPQGFLTPDEIALWLLYYERKKDLSDGNGSGRSHI